MSCDRCGQDGHIVCRCEEITEEEILEAIRGGRHTLKSVKRATRAGMGACQGRTCGALVSRLLTEQGVAPEQAFEPDKKRFPFVPVPLSSAGCGDEDE
jgi:NAD(P)H-nitrite reductase large subunit